MAQVNPNGSPMANLRASAMRSAGVPNVQHQFINNPGNFPSFQGGTPTPGSGIGGAAMPEGNDNPTGLASGQMFMPSPNTWGTPNGPAPKYDANALQALVAKIQAMRQQRSPTGNPLDQIGNVQHPAVSILHALLSHMMGGRRGAASRFPNE